MMIYKNIIIKLVCLTKCPKKKEVKNMEVILELSDHNKKEIEQIDACKKELIDLCIKQHELYKNFNKVFEKIKAINFSKRVQDPCKKCIVRPMCTENCIFKEKQISISIIKQEIKKDFFVSDNAMQISRPGLPMSLQNPSQVTRKLWKHFLYPGGWELE
jgi:radical SAM protein with 4Fe4S-binding SPASM domain